MKRSEKREERLRREFLPEALELVETPASPWGHFGILLICTIVIAMLLWAILGEMDVTVTSRGTLAAGGEQGLQIVQAENGGSVKSIKVKEGQLVKKGDTLLELVSDNEKGVSELYANTQDGSLYKEKLIRRLQDGKNLESVKETKFEEIYEYVVSVQDRNVKKIEGITQEVRSAKEELRTLEVQIGVLKNEEKDYRELFQGGAVSKAEWEQKKYELKVQQQNKATAQEKIRTLDNSVSAARSEYESELASMLLECQKEIEEGQVNAEQSERQLESCVLKAPVSGTIKTVLVNTEGAVVTPAQQLIEIVPEEEDCMMELTVLNQDIGYIRKGQTVSIKFDTYDYQKYGKATGEVIYISPDSYSDEQLGAVYKIKVQLSRKELSEMFQGKDWHTGIQGTAEIKVGERRIINFFIEPLRDHLDGSLNTP